ncbi:MAG: transcriptional repressor NrdR [Saprospiraceae bacterium]|jgi:transcriptional repressor NrdR
MRCPFCQSEDTRVIDSRESDSGETVRRRRTCQSCSERYTTYERVELHLPQVVKSDNKQEKFSEQKLRDGFSIALQKRPITQEAIESAIQRLLRKFSFSGEDEIKTEEIGSAVMDELRDLDEVAYVRFASVYRRFQDLDEFNELVQKLKDVLPAEPSKKADIAVLSPTEKAKS